MDATMGPVVKIRSITLTSEPLPEVDWMEADPTTGQVKSNNA